MKLTIEVELTKTDGPRADDDEAFEALDEFLDGQTFDNGDTVFEVKTVKRVTP